MPSSLTDSTGASEVAALPVGGVRVHTLGRFLIEVDGNPLRFEAKSRRKPLELLKVLVAEGGESVPTEPLIESLWPDSDGDRAHSAFTTTLGRLRKLIGASSVTLQDARLTLDPRHCWVDARAFSDALEFAGRALNGERPDEAWRHLETALGLYRGPFLEGEFDPPEILSARERLHGLFLRHIEKLAGFFSERGETQRAITLYQQGLEVDDLAEELYRHLMECYLELGRLVEGMATYRRCKQIFRASVGIDPSPETEALHEALLAAQAQRDAAPATPDPAPSGGSASSLVPETPVSVSATRPRESVRRTATIVTYRIAGYQALSERLDPEEVEEVLEQMRAEMERIIEGYGGILNDFLLDAAVAVFGIPTANEDDPQRAVQASLELQMVTHGISVQVEPTSGVPLRLRTGIHTGLTLAHPRDGSATRYDMTGEAPAASSALASTAAEDELLVSADTHRLVEPFFVCDEREPLRLPGRPHPLPAFAVMEASGTQTRLEAAVARGLSEFSGREAELAILNGALERAIAGEGQLVTVVGEPGLGKSRLLYEFAQGIDRGKVNLVEARALSIGSDTPYLPHQLGVRNGLGITDADPPEERPAKAIQAIQRIDPALESYIPYILYLLALSSPEYPLPPDLSAEELRQGLHDAMIALVVQSAAKRPLVIVHEDYHWVDDSSLAALRAVVNMAGVHRLMVVVSYRPDYGVNWGNLSYHTNVLLRPLTEAQSRSIMCSTLGVSDLPAYLVERIHERTAGNPFFIEEICNALREEGALVIENDVATLTRPPQTVELPDTVQAVIRTRFDRLGRDEQQTLRLAAVIGRDFTQRLLERIASEDVPLIECLERLTASELIQQKQVVPEPAYRFKHILTQLVTYSTLLVQQRRKLHALVGDVLEGTYGDRVDDHAEELAYHFERSNETERATRYLHLAGDRAARLFALEDARRHYRAALERLDALSSNPDRKRERIEVSLKWAAVSYYVVTPEHLEVVKTSCDYARQLGDASLLGYSVHWCGRLSAVVGNVQKSREYYETALELAQTDDLPDLETRTLNSMGRLSVHLAEYRQGLAHLDRILPKLEQWPDGTEWIFSAHMRGCIHGSMGEFDTCFEWIQKAIDRARAEGNVTQESAALAHRSWMHALRGEWEASIQCGETAADQGERIGNRLITSEGLIMAGYARVLSGTPEEGLAEMERGMALRRAPGFIGVLTFFTYQAEALALVGDRKDAEAAIRHAWNLREQSGHRSGDIAIARAQAVVAAPDGFRVGRLGSYSGKSDLRAAQGHLKRAIAVAEERGARPDGALANYRAAELEHLLGDPGLAKQYLDKAIAEFKALGMSWWLDHANTLAKELGGKSAGGGTPARGKAKASSRPAARSGTKKK